MNKKLTKMAAAAFAACAISALPSLAAAHGHADSIYDRYAKEHPSATTEAKAFDNTRIHAVVVGSDKDYLSRAPLFLEIIADEMNDDDHHHTPVIADQKVQTDWISFCNWRAHTGEHILVDEFLIEYAGRCGTPVLFVYPMEDVKFSERKKFDDGKLKTVYYADQRFAVILVDNSRIVNRYDYNVQGDSSRSQDRALVDAFEEGVEQAEKMLFKWR